MLWTTILSLSNDVRGVIVDALNGRYFKGKFTQRVKGWRFTPTPPQRKGA